MKPDETTWFSICRTYHIFFVTIRIAHVIYVVLNHIGSHVYTVKLSPPRRGEVRSQRYLQALTGTGTDRGGCRCRAEVRSDGKRWSWKWGVPNLKTYRTNQNKNQRNDLEIREIRIWWFETFGLWLSRNSWECHHPNWRTPIFFRGVGIPPTRD